MCKTKSWAETIRVAVAITKNIKEVLKNKCYKNFFGVVIVLCWALTSFFLTQWIIKRVTPKEVFLGEYPSCGYATISECAEKEIKPRAKQEIEDNLQLILKDIEKIDAIFRLPLTVLQFDTIIVERGSEIQARISEPKSNTTLLSGLDLKCLFDEKSFIVKAYSRSEVVKTIQLTELKDDKDIGNITENIMYNFSGCNWFTQKDVKIYSPIHKEIAPGATFSAVEVLKPYIIFEPKLLGRIFVFIAWFAIIGIALTLIKQICQIIKKGINYFCD